MNRSIIGTSLAAFLLTAALGAPAIAEDIYINNKLYKGKVTGFGMDTEFEVQELAKALKLEAVRDNGYWVLGKIRVPARKEKKNYYTTLRDLKAAGMVVTPNPSLELIDISSPQD